MKLRGRKCQCRECGRVFGAVTGFDLHRQGPMSARYCSDPAALGLVEKDGVWKKPISPEEIAKLTRRKAKLSTIAPEAMPAAAKQAGCPVPE
ncbi:MAG: hypothetical protein ACREX9_23150 [Gammaproteobacteria bacterium]